MTPESELDRLFKRMAPDGAHSTTSQAKTPASRRDDMIALAREIRREFAKIHEQMDKLLGEANRRDWSEDDEDEYEDEDDA